MLQMRVIAILALFSLSLAAQLPKPFYPWWSSQVVKDLNLNQGQRIQVRTTIRDYRGRLLDLRSQIETAERDLEYQFNQQPVDGAKANEAIERLAGARADLTRTLSQMSLKLRAVLTQQQWQELQKRRPLRGQPARSPETDQR